MKNMSLKKKIVASVVAASVSVTTFAPASNAQDIAPGNAAVEEGITVSIPNSPLPPVEVGSSGSSTGSFIDQFIQMIIDFWNNITRNFGSSNNNNALAPKIIPDPTNPAPAPAPVPKPAPAPSQNHDALRSQITDEINNFRRSQISPTYNRIPKIKQSAKLQRGSQAWADEMARTGKKAHDPRFSIDGADSENLFFTSNPNMTAKQVVNSWINSPGHRKNMLSAGNEVGIGLARDSRGVWYVVARFGDTFSFDNELLTK